jgi:hypothetical protein
MNDLNAHDFIVVASIDLPIEQWYDVMKWWVDATPRDVLQPSIRWACEQRAHDLATLLNYRESLRR